MDIIVGPYGMQSPHPHRRPHVDMYSDLILHAQRAEQLGFDGIALTEHSFWYDGYCPSLLPTLAAVAQKTEQLKLVTGALLLPQHDPLKVAEEAAVVDRLSGGRLVLGLGAGYRPEEFLGHGVPEGRWGARLFEAFEVVRLALTEDSFSFDGDFYHYDSVHLATRPIQDPVPMWICAGYADWSAKGSGRRGWPYCTTGDLEGGGSVFDTYEETAVAAGHDPASLRRGLFRDVIVMPNKNEVDEIADEDFWAAFSDQFLGFGFLKWTDENGKQITQMPEELKDMFVRSPRNAVGTPAEVREQMKAVIEMDVDMLLVRMGWANFNSPRILRTMETFASEIMPVLRSKGGR